MNHEIKMKLDELQQNRTLSEADYLLLLTNNTQESRDYAAALAREVRHLHYGHKVFVRGLIEISNICRNDCLYCGIRKGNQKCSRYRLTEDVILDCCRRGYELGFRTFVLQGGEDGYFTDSRLEVLLREMKQQYPDCAITLSLGERGEESYRRLYEAGADRYLLRHETATEEHYRMLHPEELKFANRMECLRTLRRIGYQTGCGFMVGSPFQKVEHLVRELIFLEDFKPQMCGIGPFISHKDTPFAGYANGTVEDTLYLLSLIRMIHPKILLPATTALGTLREGGREAGILAGANVVMPNLSPEEAGAKYRLYDNKLFTGAEGANGIAQLKERMAAVGYEVVTDRGDYCT